MQNKRRIAVLTVAVIVVVSLVFIFTKEIGFFSGKVIAEANVESNMDKFVDCLNEKNIVLLSAGKNSYVEAQLNLFGESQRNLTLVDCYSNYELCNGVVIYPSWRIDGRIVPGALSLGALSHFSGCSLS